MPSTLDRTKLTLTMTVIALIALAVVVLATQHAWPFSGEAGSSHGQPHSERTGEELWNGEISLVLNQHYPFDRAQVAPREQCNGCLTLVRAAGGGLSLEAQNGILVWPKPQRPSYSECVHLRDSGTRDAVPLKVSPGDPGAAVGSWLCATGGYDDDILRLQYKGAGEGGSNSYRFAVTTWTRPLNKG